jgi:hypothetical protein
VNQQRLLDELSRLGVLDFFLRMLRRLYMGDSFSILLNEQASSRSFQVHNSVHEGSPLSPLLFILFIARLTQHLRERLAANIGIRLKAQLVIRCLLYADDVLLLSPTREGLQMLIDDTCRFLDQLGLTVNPLKSDVVIFSNAQVPNPTSFNISNHSKNATDESKYLGLIFQKGGNWRCQLETTLTRCQM